METSTAAGLVGAAMLSTLIFPFVAMALRKGGERVPDETQPPSAARPAPA